MFGCQTMSKHRVSRNPSANRIMMFSYPISRSPFSLAYIIAAPGELKCVNSMGSITVHKTLNWNNCLVRNIIKNNSNYA